MRILAAIAMAGLLALAVPAGGASAAVIGHPLRLAPQGENTAIVKADWYRYHHRHEWHREWREGYDPRWHHHWHRHWQPDYRY